MSRTVEARLAELEKFPDEVEFYRLVAEVKRSRSLIERYAERIGRIDARIFTERTGLRVSVGTGTAAMLLLGIAALLLLVLAPSMRAGLHGLLVISATFMLMTALHPIAHLLAGRALGMRFLFYFLNGPARVEPTLKVDYTSYLRSSPGARAAMHLSGIIASILATLVGFLAAYLSGAPAFAKNLLLLLLILNTLFEFSPPLLVKLGFRGFRKSDAYRFFRELKLREEA